MNKLKTNATNDIILSNLVLVKPIFLNVLSSPLSNNFINKNCEDNKKINGNISYNKDGIFKRTKKIGK
jgi:hypothetical protein